MNLRHATALALVGWYLMAPPMRFMGPTDDPGTKVKIDTDAPLSEWTTTDHKFASEQECQEWLRKIIAEIANSQLLGTYRCIEK